MANFEKAFAELIGNEGGFKRENEDRMDWDSGHVGVGNLVGTKYGLSAGSYPNLDIPNLTLDDARAIYRADFWSKFDGDSLDYEVAFQLFDADVNHGMGNGTRFMQRALGVADDGKIGPVTLRALHAMDPLTFNMLFLAERLEFFTKCSTWDKDGRGWARRVAGNMRKAVTK
jgi:lysozyme family protein